MDAFTEAMFGELLGSDTRMRTDHATVFNNVMQ